MNNAVEYILPVSFVGGALAFLVYCYQFDKNRRSQPDFKKKLVERRIKEREEQKNNASIDDTLLGQKFMEYLNHASYLSTTGQFEEAVNLFAEAFITCRFPIQPMEQTLKQLLPPEHFQNLKNQITAATKTKQRKHTK